MYAQKTYNLTSHKNERRDIEGRNIFNNNNIS